MSKCVHNIHHYEIKEILRILKDSSIYKPVSHRHSLKLYNFDRVSLIKLIKIN